MLARKRQLAERYKVAFADIDGVRFLSQPSHCSSNYWLNAILLETPDLVIRNTLLTTLNAAGLMARPAWTLLNKLPMYVDNPTAALPNAERIEATLINIPSSACLAEVTN